MTIQLKMTGLQGLEKAVAQKNYRYGRGYKRGLQKACRYVLGLTQRIVPVRTGYLKSTANWEVKGDGFRAYGLIGYSAEYAMYVHENVHHTFKKGKSAKFIQKPIEQSREKINQIIRDEMRIG